jgi:hypothetical protein
MRKVVGTILLVFGWLLEGFLILVLLLALLISFGVLKSGSGYPGFLRVFAAGLVLQLVVVALIKTGVALRESTGHLRIGPVVGTILVGVGFLVEGFLVLALGLAVLNALGVLKGGADYPGFVPLLSAAFVLQLPLLALIKGGFVLRESSGEGDLGLRESGGMSIKPEAAFPLLFVGLVISVVAFLKTCVPYFQTKSTSAGIGALISALTFTVLSILLIRLWNKTMK